MFHTDADSAKVSQANWTVAWALVLGISSLVVWLIFVGWKTLSGAGILLHSLVMAEFRTVGPVLFLVVAAIFVAERVWPAVSRPAMSRAHVVDAGYLLLFVVIAPLVALLNTGFVVEIAKHAPFLILDRIPLIPQLIIVGFILVGLDGMNWLAHTANHRYEALWRLHALHHSQEDMSVFTTFRTHPLAHASYMLSVLPALVLQASGTLPGASIVLYGCLVTLPHANLRWSYGELGRVIVSPAYHRLHHSRTPIKGKMAVNYGFVLTVWDRMAGSAVFPTAGEVIKTGIGGRPVPVEQVARRSRVVPTMWAQIVQPFRMNPKGNNE